MSKPIINIDEVEFDQEVRHGDRFEAKLARLSPRVGASKLAYNITAVPPGKRAFPLHNHHTNEELFFVLQGGGTLRFGDGEHPVREGDIIACPPGGPEVAHQLINTGDTELRYLALSTTDDTDVIQYPDSGKFGVVAGWKPGQRPHEAPFVGFFVEDARVEYWKDE
jgi:uncharacterized cupin superfamily protein